ncbi:MAG: glycosyltransferase family 4 protein [Candidatus Paceibacterota bacterium]
MKLLIITQKVDKDDPVLGFFHRWLIEFAEDWDLITVICLQIGVVELPKNVKVYSLGKEDNVSILTYLKRFYQYIWRFRRDYDAVFVHMNQEYVLLGAWLWRLWGKKTALWYNHTSGSWLTRLAGKMVHLVFHTSAYAYTAQFNNARSMPAGIDLSRFKIIPSAEKISHSVLSLGRLAPVKGIHTLIAALNQLDQEGFPARLNIYGEADALNSDYFHRLKQSAGRRVKFCGSVPNYQTPEIYYHHEVFVNLTPPGNYDKTVLEAMACGLMPVVASPAFADIVPSALRPDASDPSSIALCLKCALVISSAEKQKLTNKFQTYVVENHSLALLSKQLSDIFTSV